MTRENIREKIRRLVQQGAHYNGEKPCRILIVWDGDSELNMKGAEIAYWNNRVVPEKTISIPQLVDLYGLNIRKEFVDALHAFGQLRVFQQPISNFFSLGGGISYWWLAPIFDKSPFLSPEIFQIFKVRALELYIEKEKITQVISNLVENAVKYSPVGADIGVEVSLVNAEAEIVVSDNGYGISKDDQERIFEKFFRSRTEENWEVPGTGLGLSLVKRIVDMHGGSVSLDSEPGEGTSFTILLPISNDEASEDADGDRKEYLGTDVTDSDPESPEARAVTTLRNHRTKIILDREGAPPESGADSGAAA